MTDLRVALQELIDEAESLLTLNPQGFESLEIAVVKARQVIDPKGRER